MRQGRRSHFRILRNEEFCYLHRVFSIVPVVKYMRLLWICIYREETRNVYRRLLDTRFESIHLRNWEGDGRTTLR
jgi:hypothetical protein